MTYVGTQNRNMNQVCDTNAEPIPRQRVVSPQESSSRRRFLQSTMTGALAGLFTTGAMSSVFPTPVLAQQKLGPSAALQELMDGNRRFISNNMTHCEKDLAILRQHTVEGQEPFAAVLSCADSRVPIELIFDQTIGHIFVTRVAGNVVSPEIIGSLEFGAVVLGARVIMVLGHAGCGAVKAAIAGTEVPGQISSLFPHIRPAVDQAGTDVVAATKANAKIQAAILRQGSTVISGMVKEGKIKVVAGYYDLETGSVTLLD